MINESTEAKVQVIFLTRKFSFDFFFVKKRKKLILLWDEHTKLAFCVIGTNVSINDLFR